MVEVSVVQAVAALRALAEHNVARVGDLVRTSFDAPADLEAISSVELLECMRIESVTLLDLRPPDEFAAGHLPGAVNITLAELEDRLTDVPLNREVLAYCRGPYCMLSVDAVRALQRQGYRARRLQEGLPEWRAAGLPVTQSGP